MLILTIHNIKAAVENSKEDSYFFSRDTMKGFNQTLGQFTVKHIGNRCFIHCPSYWTNMRGEKELMGYTLREFIPDPSCSQGSYPNKGRLEMPRDAVSGESVPHDNREDLRKFYKEVKWAEQDAGNIEQNSRTA